MKKEYSNVGIYCCSNRNCESSKEIRMLLHNEWLCNSQCEEMLFQLKST